MRKKRKDEHDDPGITDINVTPLVDVCLVLVIIFMVTQILRCRPALELFIRKLGPQQGKFQRTRRSERHTHQYRENNNKRQGSKHIMADVLREKIALSKDKTVTLIADKENRCYEVVNILDISKQNGARKLALMSKKKD